MQWLKWTLFAAVGCLPVLALADEPAKKDKDKDKDALPKFELRIEVQKLGEKPHVLVFGDGAGKDGETLSKLLAEMSKNVELKVKDAKADKPPKLEQDAVMHLTNELAKKAMTLAVRVHGEKGTFLGVGTSAPPAVLIKQLGLHDGMGLVADEVVPDGPAAKAGLKQYDVLEKFDDQLIINFEQLAVLVHSHKPGDEVKLTVIHEGKPAVLTVKLAEHEMRLGMWDDGKTYQLRVEAPFNAHARQITAERRMWEVVRDKAKQEKK